MDLQSGYPYWSVAHGLLSVFPPLGADAHCDVAVVGGGITGALIAHHLIAAGIDTIVLDAREIGWGSTCATTGLIQYEIDTPLCELASLIGEDRAVRSYRACYDAIGKLEALARSLPNPCGFERKTSVEFASRRVDVAGLRADFEMRQRHGYRVEWMDAPQVREKFSFRRPAVVYSCDAAQLDAYAMTHALLGTACRRGLRVFDRTKVTTFACSPNGVRLETERGYSVTAGRVVFATGYETEQYLPRPVGRLVSTYAIVSEPLNDFDGWYEQCLLWETARPYIYLRPVAGGRAMIGGEDEMFSNPARRDRLIARKARALQRRFTELFPRIPFETAFAWTGTFGETKDGLAYIDETPEFPRAHFVLAYGGNGITFGLISAEIIRDAVLGKPNDDAQLFRFDR